MVLQGKGAGAGTALGKLYIYSEKYNVPAESVIRADECQSHLDRYNKIKKEALCELDKLKSSVQKADIAKGAIFDAHKEIVEDIILNEEIPAKIQKEFWSGDRAIYHVYETVLNAFKKTPDPLIAERAADFDDVRALLLRLWNGQKSKGLSGLKEPVIIAAGELKPSDTAGLDREKVLAILTETGGVTSHAAIIAKSYGIPAVLGINELLNNVTHGQVAAVDAEKGTVVLDPDTETAAQFNKKSGAFRRDKQDAAFFMEREGRTLCGVKIDIGLNIVNAGNEELCVERYVDSVGLFRTEFLFMGNTLPSEEEQFSSYRKVLECFGKRQVTLRTLDIGGDKQVPWAGFKREDNPFLGNRGIRFCLSNPEIFKTQIRAALRASYYGNLAIMLPMVGSLEDIRAAKAVIAEVNAQLKKEKIQTGAFKIGIMVEIPSIALISGLTAKEVDFASIGSNDLCQYLCAADRMNSDVQNYYQQYHPAMWKLIKETVTAFAQEVKPVSICGELGSDPAAVPALIGLGLRKLSMGAASVAPVKRAIAGLSIEKAQEIAQKVLDLPTADEIKRYLIR
ncbi:MAG: phosphoenolpyruvate--protein phosphotransferase [Treponema sp.]|nr:phosphoenolpyruvate--protein phosphotransferase [Treponema sp.]